MKIMILPILMTTLLTSAFASDVELLQKDVSVELGDISDLAEDTLVKKLNLIQTSKTPKKVMLKIKYTTPSLECTDEEAYVHYPVCDDDDDEMFPNLSTDCDPYVAYKCVRYEFDHDYKVGKQAVYKLKFSRSTSSKKSFSIDLTKIVSVKRISDIMVLKPKFNNGDFKSIKVKKPNLLRKKHILLIK